MTLSQNDDPPHIPPRLWKIAAVTGAAAFMAMLDSTVANLALESIGRDFESSLAVTQWVATGYLIALAVSLPTTGWLGHRYGYGRVWAASMATFIISSALCGLAPGPTTLIAARLLQGLAAGLMVPAGQAVIGSTAHANQLGRLMGTLGLVIALGPAVGPGIAGFLLDMGSWRWLFLLNVPIGILAIIAARDLVPRGSKDEGRPLDRMGFVLVGLGLPVLLYGANRIGTDSADIIAVSAVAIGVVMTACFVPAQLRTRYPLIDIRLMHRRPFSAATITTGLTGASMYGGLLLLPLYLQLAAGRSAGETGLLLLAMGLGSAVVLPVAGSLTDRFGTGATAIAGAALLLASTIPFVVNPTALSITTQTVLLISRGIGLALAQLPAMTAAYGTVTRDQMGDAATLVNIVQRLGGAMGAFGVVIVLTSSGGTARIDAYVGAFAALAGLAALALVSTARMCAPERNPYDRS